MKTIDRHFRDLTKAAFARHGFAYADLLAQWGAIMGDLAHSTLPEKIRWPRGAGDEAQKKGGTLHLRVRPGQALDIQYQGPAIIERVNAYLGYGAIAAIKTRQDVAFGPEPKAAAKAPSPETTALVEDRLASIADPDLRDALRRLGHGALSARSPQAK